MIKEAIGSGALVAYVFATLFNNVGLASLAFALVYVTINS